MAPRDLRPRSADALRGCGCGRGRALEEVREKEIRCSPDKYTTPSHRVSFSFLQELYAVLWDDALSAESLRV